MQQKSSLGHLQAKAGSTIINNISAKPRVPQELITLLQSCEVCFQYWEMGTILVSQVTGR